MTPMNAESLESRDCASVHRRPSAEIGVHRRHVVELFLE
jgi:hypothetical protein